MRVRRWEENDEKAEAVMATRNEGKKR